MNKIQLVMAAVTLSSTLSLARASTGALSSTICGIIGTVQSVIGVLALVLFVLGGVLYLISHFVPSSVKFRESLQGWATEMIIGGVIALIIVIVAPEIVGFIEGVSVGFGGTTGSNIISCGP